MRLPAWLKRRRLDLDDHDFQEEIRAHLAIAAGEKVEDGVDPEHARYAALREFGNVTLTREATRRVWMPRWLEAVGDLIKDARYAARALGRNPVFAITVVGVLAIGIGLNAAVFTMLKAIVLTPVPGVARSADLVVLFGETSGGRQLRLSYPDFQTLRSAHQGFADLFGSSLAIVNLGRGRGARQVYSELVTGTYFQALGVTAQHGRVLQASDERQPGAHPVAVISDALWRRDFHADPAIVGRTIDLNGYAFTVVGVADAAFHGTIVSNDVEVFLPVLMAREIGLTGALSRADAPNLFSDRRAAVVFAHGYLRPGVTVAQAAAEADAIWAPLAKERPIDDAVSRVRVLPFSQSPTGGQRFVLPSLVALSVMGLVLLLVACANVAGLVLVRGLSRRGEIAIRLALGASRTRIVRLLIVENLLLALPGALLGLLLASRGMPWLVGYAEWLAAPQRLYLNLDVDGLVLAFAAAVACACALIFGFVPALQSARVDLVSVINADATPRGAPRARLRAALVVAQVAVSLPLLVGAELAVRTVAAAREADPGFESAGATAIALDVKQNGYAEARGRAFYRQLLEAARREPGIDAASLAQYVPLNLLDSRAQRIAVEQYEPRRGEDLMFLSNVVSSDYFRTLRIPVIAGRAFEDRDDETTTPVAIVNRAFAVRFWGEPAGAIGQRLRVAGEDWRTVVGVAADVKYARINEEPRPYVYLPLFQAYRSTMTLHTAGPTPPARQAEQLRARIEAIDPDMPVLFARPLEEATRGAFIFYDFTATMLFVFGIAGLLLAALGTYGLVAYVVRQSTREIGIRLALGASRWSIVRGFVGRGVRLGAVGAVIGIAAALAVGRVLSGLLFGVSATDAAAFTSALVVVGAGVLVATLVPASKAARTDPLRALRHQ